MSSVHFMADQKQRASTEHKEGTGQRAGAGVRGREEDGMLVITFKALPLPLLCDLLPSARSHLIEASHLPKRVPPVGK